MSTLTQNNPDVGNGTVLWDGEGANGQQAPAGVYYIVTSAVNGAGNSVLVTPSLAGTVTGVRYEGGEPILVLDGGEAPLSGVARIYQQEAD